MTSLLLMGAEESKIIERIEGQIDSSRQKIGLQVDESKAISESRGSRRDNLLQMEVEIGHKQLKRLKNLIITKKIRKMQEINHTKSIKDMILLNKKR